MGDRGSPMPPSDSMLDSVELIASLRSAIHERDTLETLLSMALRQLSERGADLAAEQRRHGVTKAELRESRDGCARLLDELTVAQRRLTAAEERSKRVSSRGQERQGSSRREDALVFSSHPLSNHETLPIGASAVTPMKPPSSRPRPHAIYMPSDYGGSEDASDNLDLTEDSLLSGSGVYSIRRSRTNRELPDVRCLDDRENMPPPSKPARANRTIDMGGSVPASSSRTPLMPPSSRGRPDKDSKFEKKHTPLSSSKPRGTAAHQSHHVRTGSRRRLRRSSSVPYLTPVERVNEVESVPRRVVVEEERRRRNSDENLNMNAEVVDVDSDTTANSVATDSECEEPASSTQDSLDSDVVVFVGQRRHRFKKSRVLLRDYCDVCCRSIRFNATVLKCRDCREVVHEECAVRACVPCCPRPSKLPAAPGFQPKNEAPARLKDWCDDVATPSIPHLVIKCVLHLDKHCLNEVGLWRQSGGTRAVCDLLHKFRVERRAPSLTGVDGDTVTSCIKRFLKEFKDPLILPSSYKDFVNAAFGKDGRDISGSLMRAVEELPGPNRDTLAFLCAHWQRVADRSEVNRMSLDNVARVVGPTVVGGADSEVNTQIDVMTKLLQLDRAFFNQFAVTGLIAVRTPAGGSTLRRPMVASSSQRVAFPSTTPRLPSTRKRRERDEERRWK